MSAEQTHTNHHEPHIAYGTGCHTHHRATLEDGGQRVAYWRCEKGTPPLRACPDEPDPFARLIVKIAEAGAPPVEGCRHGHDPEYLDINSQGNRICLECRRLASLKARMKRAADRIAA